MENIFEGIGTEIIGIIISAILGGFIGYKIGISKTQKSRKK